LVRTIDSKSAGVRRTLVRCGFSGKIKKSDPQGEIMPYVSIRVAGTLSKEQKQNISKGVTEVISKEANKPPEAVLIFIDEIERDNVAKAGKLLSDT
jgi:4-oxalocrotonate tautomerase